jgi:hypothetical protein
MELFFCPPVSTSLTREGCAKLFVKARDLLASGTARTSSLMDSCRPCIKCPVGEAHEKNQFVTEWPDGTKLNIREVSLRPFASEPPKKPSKLPAPTIVPVPVPEPVRAHVADSVPYADVRGTEVQVQVLGPVPDVVLKPEFVLQTKPASDYDYEYITEGAAHLQDKVEREEGVNRRNMVPGRPAALYTHAGKTMTAVDWCKDEIAINMGLTPSLLRARRNKGWEDDKIFTTPVAVTQGAMYPMELDINELPVDMAKVVNSIIKEFELTNRTGDALISIVMGMDRVALGQKLGVKYNTVKTTYHRLFSVLGLSSEAEVMRMVTERLVSSTKPKDEGEETMPADDKYKKSLRWVEGQLRCVEEEPRKQVPVVAKQADEDDDHDRELEAMNACVRALKSLDDNERARVLTWICSRFNVTAF